MKLPQFDYCAPDSVDEIVRLLAENEDAKIISGGQSLMPVLAFRLASPSMLIDMRKVPGLDRIEVDEDGVHLGARVRWCDIQNDPRLTEAHPLIHEMISHVAHTQVRNRGTVGGSLAHADPAAEMPGLAVVCDCRIEIAGPDGQRSMPSSKLFAGPLETSLGQADVITGVRFPVWPQGRLWAFVEVARRKGDFAMAGIAVFYDLDASGAARNVHVGAIGVGNTPLRLSKVEGLLEARIITEDLIEEARRTASEEVSPMSDMHGAEDYRRSLAGTLTARAIRKAARLEQ